MQLNTPQSSPYQLNLGDPIVSGQYVGLRPNAYDPGVACASCYAILDGELVHLSVTAHHVELVNGQSTGKKIAVLSVNGTLAKLNVPSGAGVYGFLGLDVRDDGTVVVDAVANDGPIDAAKNPTLLWHQSTITGAPLAGVRRLTKANLAALVGGSGGSDDDSVLTAAVASLVARVTTLESQIADHWNRLNDDDTKIKALQDAEAGEGQPQPPTAHYVLTKNGTVVYQD